MNYFTTLAYGIMLASSEKPPALEHVKETHPDVRLIHLDVDGTARTALVTKTVTLTLGDLIKAHLDVEPHEDLILIETAVELGVHADPNPGWLAFMHTSPVVVVRG